MRSKKLPTPDTTTAPGTPRRETITNWHDVLEDPTRRLLIHTMTEADGWVTLAALTEAVASDGRTDGERPSRVIDTASLRQTLYHRHVLELEAFGVLEYDHETESVRLAEDVSVTVPAPENA